MVKNNLILHCHTDQSLKDGAQTVKQLVARAKELGASGVTLTDHGVLTGTYEFLAECKAAGIKGIPGVEAYISEDDDVTRRHLILLAKDRQGYKAIEKAVTESNRRLVHLRTKDIPTMNKEIITKWFGKGSSGHNHVIATSACVQGVIATEINRNEVLEKEIAKYAEKRNLYIAPTNPEYQKLKAELDKKISLEEAIKNQLAKEKKIASTPTTKLNKQLQRAEGSFDYEKLKADYEKLLADIHIAAENADKLKLKQKDIKKDISELKKRCKGFEDSIEKWKSYDELISQTQGRILPEIVLMENAKTEAKWYLETFGEGNFFIELQYHYTKSETYVFPRLNAVAKQLGIPTVAANDAHYTRMEDARKREIIVSDLFKRPLDEKKIDATLYIKSDKEILDAISTIISETDVQKAIDNLKLIEDACDVELGFEAHYPKFNKLPEGVSDREYIKKLCLKGIKERYPNGVSADGNKWDDEHKERLKYELKVIDEMGFNNYHLVVQDYLNYGKSLIKEFPEKVGYTIGPGRGSAVGSLVCYLLGITNLDPIQYSLLFERYLNTERVTMPDIDADFAKCVRDKCIEYMRTTYGPNAVSGVTTKGTLKMRAAVLLAGRVNPQTFNDISKVRAITKAIPKDAKSFTSPISSEDKQTVKDYLLEMFSGKVEQQIIKDAASIEGLTVSFGRHAAAVIISDTGDVSDQVALISNDKGEWAVQCVKEEAEANAGLLKMDFLGLINLDIITGTLRKVYNNYGVSIDMDKDVKFEEEVFENIFSTGNTDAVFQFSSGGMKQMLKDFRPSCFEDLILLVAAYRPGPMQYIPDVIAVKHGRKKMEYPIKELEPILKTTYGKTIYQEQVQEIFKKLAGYSLGQADLVRRAMSKKKMDKLAHEKEAFLHGDKDRNIKGCVANGINEADAEKLFTELMDFASYGFNKSHAAAYALIAYQTAWLKYHYPYEYMASVMENSPYDKTSSYIFNCKDMNLHISLPDINSSEENFKASKDDIRIGFSAVKGIGTVDFEKILEERKNGPYTSVKNFILRTDVGKDSFESLVYSGAFDSFNKNRTGVYNYGMHLKELKQTLKKMETRKEKLEADMQLKTSASLEKRLNVVNSDISGTQKDINNLVIVEVSEDPVLRLAKEREIIGSFISDHPINSYKVDERIQKIKDISEGKEIKLCGLITDLRMLRTKKKGENFCAFTLDDGTGSIECTVFPTEYKKMLEKINENVVVSFVGDINKEIIESFKDDESDSIVYKYVIKRLGEEPQKKQNSLILSVAHIPDWIDKKPLVEEYVTTGEGFNLLVYDRLFCQLRRTGLLVSENIKKDENLIISNTAIVE